MKQVFLFIVLALLCCNLKGEGIFKYFSDSSSVIYSCPFPLQDSTVPYPRFRVKLAYTINNFENPGLIPSTEYYQNRFTFHCQVTAIVEQQLSEQTSWLEMDLKAQKDCMITGWDKKVKVQNLKEAQYVVYLLSQEEGRICLLPGKESTILNSFLLYFCNEKSSLVLPVSLEAGVASPGNIVFNIVPKEGKGLRIAGIPVVFFFPVAYNFTTNTLTEKPATLSYTLSTTDKNITETVKRPDNSDKGHILLEKSFHTKSASGNFESEIVIVFKSAGNGNIDLGTIINVFKSGPGDQLFKVCTEDYSIFPFQISGLPENPKIEYYDNFVEKDEKTDRPAEFRVPLAYPMLGLGNMTGSLYFTLTNQKGKWIFSFFNKKIAFFSSSREVEEFKGTNTPFYQISADEIFKKDSSH